MVFCCIVGCANNNRLKYDRNTTYHIFPHPINDRYRHIQWLECVNNPRVSSKTSMQIYKLYRICRLHFAPNCFNGACRRLLPTAVPTLLLNLNKNESFKYKDDNIDLHSKDSTSNELNIQINLEEINKYDDDNDYNSHMNDLVETSSNEEDYDLVKDNSETIVDDDNIDETEVEYFFVDDENSDYNDEEMDEEEIVSSQSYKIELNGEIETTFRKSTEINQSSYILTPLEMNDNTEEGTAFEEEVEYIDVDDGHTVVRNLAKLPAFAVQPITIRNSSTISSILAPITSEHLSQWRKSFYNDPKNIIAQNACSRVDPLEVCTSRQALQATTHVYSHKIETEGKPITNQKSSGRCWLFAALNCIRVPFIKLYNLEEFEFSQSYLFFWDKISRCHHFLHKIVETAKRGEEIDGRLVTFLLTDPTCDGGQWDMILNLINNFGLMPKKCFPESFCSEASVRLNSVLKSKLREYTKILRTMVADGTIDNETIDKKVKEQMAEIYRIVGICLGIPNETFTWEYYDKNKAYHSVGPQTPLDFYQKYVRQCFNVDEKICLINDPRPNHPYGEMYTVDCLGNVVGGRPVLYNNQPIDLLMDLVVKSIKKGEPVWFGCDVAKRFSTKLGIEDFRIHDYNIVFGIDIQRPLDKADRMIFGESAMTHAMVFTAVTCDENGKAVKFRVENSWGEEQNEKGYICMSADWFKEYVYEIVVDQSHVPEDVMDVFKKTPTVLPAWDPMGTLA